jgi:hypothetical protein
MNLGPARRPAAPGPGGARRRGAFGTCYNAMDATLYVVSHGVKEAIPSVYDALRDLGGGHLSLPTLEPTFVQAYENSYGTLYRHLLSSLGYPSRPEFPRDECPPLTEHLRALQAQQPMSFLFMKEPRTFGNPLLAHCGSVQTLIADWLHDSTYCLFSSNGLMYPNEDVLAQFGPPRLPASALFRWYANVRVGGMTTFDPASPSRDVIQPLAEPPPEHLFRGQRDMRRPLAPFVRRLVDRSPEEQAHREKTKFYVDDELLALGGDSLLATVNQALAVTCVLCHRFPERTADTLVPTPYNLLWRYGPWEPEAVLELCGEVFDVSIFLSTAQWGSAEELAIFISHFTDYAYAVPVHTSVQFVTDFVPNPLVSTTTDISRALLYASGYFTKFTDKFDVDWDAVERLIEIGPGFVFLIQIPDSGPRRRNVVPISAIARSLPSPYRSVGLLEGEYGVTASVRQEEIASIEDAGAVLSRLRAKGLWQALRRDPHSVDTHDVVRAAFQHP